MPDRPEAGPGRAASRPSRQGDALARPERRRALGQYFTARDVAGLVWDLLGLLTSQGQSTVPIVSGPVLEPAVGAGVFLETALERGLSPPLFTGLDLDPDLEESWRRLQGRYPGLDLRRADTLTHDLASESFALVVGNPPYGQRATGLKEPVEAAFLRRAVELCRPGGWIALILPDGLLANRRAQGLRAAVLEQAALRLVLALPPSAFRSQGAAARTALVILEKRLNREGEPSGLAFPPPPTPSPRGGGIKEARIPIRAYVDDRPALVLSAQTPDDFGPVREAVARSLTSGELVPGVRAIATVGPYQRWDPGYWDRPPSPFIAWIDGRETVPLGHYIEHLTYGPIITGSDPEPAGPVPVIGQRELGVSGLNLSTARRVRADGPHDPPRSRVREGDLLVARSGVGGLGKGRMAVAGPGITGNVSCFVDLVRLRGLDPVFAWLFLASSFGQDQIRPLINGVGTPNLSFSELRSLQIPVLPEAKQRELASLYVEQVAPHHQAFLDARGPEDTLRMRRLVEEVMRRVLREFEQALLAT